MTFEWWFAYLLTSIILSLSPGSGAINTMTTAISHGYRGASASIAGLQTGLGRTGNASFTFGDRI